MAPTSLTVIGCSDAFGSGGRGNTCFHVQSISPAVSLLIDCGATALPAMKANGISTNEIDLIVLTHFHGDHFAGLPFFILDATRLKRTKPLTIISPPGCREKLREALRLFYPGKEKVLDELAITFKSFEGRRTPVHDAVHVESFPVIHTPETSPHGVRVTLGEKVIAYSGDTEWTDTLAEIARDADLFICDCTYLKNEQKGHLSYQTILAHRDELQCKQLLLTHFDEETLRIIHTLQEMCAWDGMKIDL